MKVFYAQDPYDIEPASVFLAGPTPRSPDVPSWRPEAVKIFEEYGFDGHLYIPERDDWGSLEGYSSQIEWEHHHLNRSKAILIWIPRDLETMPALTSNVEFGLYLEKKNLNSEHVLFYGRPDEAPKNGYLDYCYTKVTGKKPSKTLDELIREVMVFVTEDV